MIGILNKYGEDCPRAVTQLMRYCLKVLKTILLLSLTKLKIKNTVLKGDED